MQCLLNVAQALADERTALCSILIVGGRSAMKRYLSAALRQVRNGISQLGIDVRTVRGREHWRAGLEFVWHKFDQRTERGAFCRVDSFGEEVVFLVKDQDDWIQRHFLTGQFYAEEELRVIQRYYTGGTFLDVGANVGNHALFAAKILKAPRVIAVEPNPVAYRLLRCHIALNDAGDVIEHLAVGLSDRDTHGSILMAGPEHNLGTASIQEGTGSVPIAIGDSIFATEQIGFVKIDVEGMEMQVLRGLLDTIRRCRAPLMIEVSDDNIDRFEQVLEQLRYDVVYKAAPYPTQTYFMAVPRNK